MRARERGSAYGRACGRPPGRAAPLAFSLRESDRNGAPPRSVRRASTQDGRRAAAHERGHASHGKRQANSGEPGTHGNVCDALRRSARAFATIGEPKIAPDEHGRQACADKPADDSATGRAAMRAAAGMTGADGRCGSDRCIRARSRRIRFRTVGVQPGGRSRSVNCRRRAMNAPARVSPPARIARASARSGIGARLNRASRVAAPRSISAAMPAPASLPANTSRRDAHPRPPLAGPPRARRRNRHAGMSSRRVAEKIEAPGIDRLPGASSSPLSQPLGAPSPRTSHHHPADIHRSARSPSMLRSSPSESNRNPRSSRTRNPCQAAPPVPVPAPRPAMQPLSPSTSPAVRRGRCSSAAAASLQSKTKDFARRRRSPPNANASAAARLSCLSSPATARRLQNE